MLWDRIQTESHCCGVDSAYDYNVTKWIRHQRDSEDSSGDIRANEFRRPSHHLVPQSCCKSMMPNPFLPDSDTDYPDDFVAINDYCDRSYDPTLIHTHGCYHAVLQWFQNSSDVLSILGFCVLSFIKVCFLCILRYEIKEMVQKIQVLQGMNDDSTPPQGFADLEAYLPRPSMQQESTQTLLTTQSPQSNHRPNYGSESRSHHLCMHNCPRPSIANIAAATSNFDKISNPRTHKKHSVV